MEGAEDSLSEKTEETTSGIGQSISDSWITTKVKSTLMYSSNVKGSNISVFTKDGVVTLSGNVGSDDEHALAVELARNFQGIHSVDAKGLGHS